jgi:ATP-dependent Clp protease ATP-binding subunit ClpC
VFERFTERARQVVVFAQDEARRLGHGYIGTEHLLLGILREEEGLGARVLGSLGVAVEETRERVATIVGRGDETPAGQIPFTPNAKRALELSLQEALSLGDGFIGTEHLLLGLCRESQGVAAQILIEAGAHPVRILNTVVRMGRGSTWADIHEVQGSAEASGWTGYAPMSEVELVDEVPVSGGEPLLLRGILIGWALGAGTLGAGLLVGWLIWG